MIPVNTTISLMHGTSSANTASIINEGIQPRKGLGNWYRAYQNPSDSRFTYLTNNRASADLYAIRAALIDGSKCSIVEVTTDDEPLYPDENFFNKTGLYDKADAKKMQSRIKRNKRRWVECLEKRGLVTHLGGVPREKIVKHEEYDVTESLFYFFLKPFPDHERDIDRFDYVFNAWLHIEQNRYFKDVIFPYFGDFKEMIKNLTIVTVEEGIEFRFGKNFREIFLDETYEEYYERNCLEKSSH